MESRLLPVIHAEDPKLALAQVGIAREAGADGVWLINHNIHHTGLWSLFLTIRAEHPDYWVGLNFLDMTALDAIAWICADPRSQDRVNGLWVDKSGVTDTGVSKFAERVWEIKTRTGWEGEYFGGVAFKYQKEVSDIVKAAELASPLMDVVTTSGPGTGQEASIDKIRGMSTTAKRLAIASGITPENVKTYLGWASDFLVATGISTSFTELDPARVKALAEVIHAYEPEAS